MNNNKQQTAVELFAIALYEGGYLQGNGDEIEKLLNTFKEMEKEQIIDAVKYGYKKYNYSPNFREQQELFKDYYNETYGGNK
jgi:hypothetical protein